jgi:hypothetical protein
MAEENALRREVKRRPRGSAGAPAVLPRKTAPRRVRRAALLVPLFLTAAAGPAPARGEPDRGRPSVLFVPKVSSGSDLRITFGADHLVLGDQDRCEVGIVAPEGTEEVEITASTGRVGEPRRVGPGRFAATYTAPDRYYPQVAIFSVSATVLDKDRRRSERFGWGVLALHGKGEALVRTKPRSKVTIRIGAATFGPVAADRHGVAAVPVVVPPGVGHGQAGAKRVDLNLPPWNRLHAMLVPSRIAGTHAQETRCYLFTIDETGAPTSARAPIVSAFGTSPAVRSLEKGVWLATILVPAGKPTALEVAAQVPDQKESQVSLALRRSEGIPAKIELVMPGQVGPDPVAVQARLTDEIGTPVDGKITGSCTEGTIEPFVRKATGLFEALYRPPESPSAKMASLEARVAGGPRAAVQILFLHRARLRVRPAVTIAVGAASGAVLLAALVMRLVALEMSSEYKDPQTSLDRRRELKDRGEPLTTASSVLFAVGGAGAAATAVLLFFTPFRAESSRAPSVSFSAGLLSIGGTF